MNWLEFEGLWLKVKVATSIRSNIWVIAGADGTHRRLVWKYHLAKKLKVFFTYSWVDWAGIETTKKTGSKALCVPLVYKFNSYRALYSTVRVGLSFWGEYRFLPRDERSASAVLLS